MLWYRKHIVVGCGHSNSAIKYMTYLQPIMSEPFIHIFIPPTILERYLCAIICALMCN